MKKLSEVKELVKCLSDSECRDLAQRLKGSGRSSISDISLVLFNTIQKNPDWDAIDYEMELYGERNVNAFNKLCARLIEKISDVLIIRDNIYNNDLYDKRAQDIFLLERQLLISDILRYRGLLNQSITKINEIIYRSKFYEHYDVLVKALEKKRRWLYTNKNERSDIVLNEDIELYNDVKKIYKKSEEIYLNIYRLKYDEFNTKMQSYFKLCIDDLTKYIKISDSNQIRLFLFYINIQYHKYLLQYDKSLSIINELVDYLSSNINIYSKLRYGNALLNLGVMYRFCFNHDLSVQYLVESKKYFSDQKQNNVIVFEQLMLSYFYSGNLAKMRYYLFIIEKECLKYDTNFISKSLLDYYLAVNYYLMQDYISCSHFLEKALEKNNEFGLNMECRILLAISYIESEKFDLADYVISNLQKYFSRFKSDKYNYRNLELSMKILIKLSANSYSYLKVEQLNINILQEIDALLTPFCFLNYEMIIFHEWFYSKVKNVPYDHIEVMKRLKKKNKALK